MVADDKIIYAPGTKHPDGKNAKKNKVDDDEDGAVISYEDYKKYGYGKSSGYASGAGLSHIIPPPPPCDTKDGSVQGSRGSMRITWASAGGSMPMGRLLNAPVEVQNNFMNWGSDPDHRFAAPPPPPDDPLDEEKEEGKECKGPRCQSGSDAEVRLVADKSKKSKKWMCWPCCWYELGASDANKRWNEAK